MGRTPLHEAVANGRTALVAALIDAGAALDAADESGRTPLHEVPADSSRSVKLLVAAGASVSAADKEGRTPLHAAATAKRVFTRTKVRYPKGWTPAGLSTAAVKQLLKAGASAAVADNEGCTPLHAADSTGWAAVAELLVAASASAAAADQGGSAPLHKAAANGHTAAVSELFADGASAAAADNAGRTPLHAAASCRKWRSGALAVVSALIEAGASAAASNNACSTQWRLHCMRLPLLAGMKWWSCSLQLVPQQLLLIRQG